MPLHREAKNLRLMVQSGTRLAAANSDPFGHGDARCWRPLHCRVPIGAAQPTILLKFSRTSDLRQGPAPDRVFAPRKAPSRCGDDLQTAVQHQDAVVTAGATAAELLRRRAKSSTPRRARAVDRRRRLARVNCSWRDPPPSKPGAIATENTRPGRSQERPPGSAQPAAAPFDSRTSCRPILHRLQAISFCKVAIYDVRTFRT